ncbi:hypothetical protein ACFQS6_03595 [Xanthomonas populi]|uniref:hypothetical protein n=1 Tax=Xanthomonas populi TaxID=53414 RepID=UPI001FC92F27|nr:hypothetical protein [Xanthomonas populi]
MGLDLVQTIMRHHGSSVMLVPDTALGACFRLAIPAFVQRPRIACSRSPASAITHTFVANDIRSAVTPWKRCIVDADKNLNYRDRSAAKTGSRQTLALALFLPNCTS